MLDEFKWQPGTHVKVRFLEGDPDLQKRVAEVAQEWTGPQMANLEPKFVDSGDADVRVAFEQGNGSWSYLGTMCQQIPADEPTMNYGWLTPDSDDDELRRVVLHEFGHALGLIHEHQNPNRPIAWNRAAVIADLSGPPNNWDRGDDRKQHVQALRPGRALQHAGRRALDHDVPDPCGVDHRRVLGGHEPGVVGDRQGVHPQRLPVVANRGLTAGRALGRLSAGSAARAGDPTAARGRADGITAGAGTGDS